MKINIKATGIELTPAVSDYVYKKLEMIEKYVGDNHNSAVAQVEVARVTEHHQHGDIFRAEIHITGGGIDVYTAEETGDIFSSLDKVKDEIILQLTRTKGKEQTLARKGGQMIKNMMKFNWFRKKK
ncbi:MAG: ribosome-associated translation inhibitor RaiA [bacterium]